MADTKKVTVYYVSEFGLHIRLEGHLAEHGTMRWAQYTSAPYLIIKPKKKRSFYRFVEGYKPTYVIIEGWGHPEIKEIGVTVEQHGNITVTKSDGTMFGQKRMNAYDDFIDNLSKQATVIADYREKEFS